VNALFLNFMDQSPSWEDNSGSSGQEISHIYGIGKFTIAFEIASTVVPILSQIDYGHFYAILRKIHFSIILI
jgi:hypothetical protein